VVVAMCSMRMMQMPFYQVVRVVSVQHRLMAAIRSVDVARFMGSAFVVRRSRRW